MPNTRNHLNDSTARKARRINLREATEERRSAMQGLDCRSKSEPSPIMKFWLVCYRTSTTDAGFAVKFRTVKHTKLSGWV
jgi:hypothetical protein